MSYVIFIEPENGLSRREASELSDRFRRTLGVDFRPETRFLASHVSGFVSTDTGELAEDHEDRFIPLSGVDESILKIVRTLLASSPSVRFLAAWLGDPEKRTVELSLPAFAASLKAGEVEDGVSYRIR